jgi:hypothetical protein
MTPEQERALSVLIERARACPTRADLKMQVIVELEWAIAEIKSLMSALKEARDQGWVRKWPQEKPNASNTRNRQLGLKRQGRCIRCGQPRVDAELCAKHKEQHRVRVLEYARKRARERSVD